MTQDDGISRAQKRAMKQTANDLAKCLDHGPARRILAQLIDTAGVFSYPTVGQGAEYREGRRSVGLDIVSMLQSADPAAFIKIQQELLAERQRRESEVEQTQGEEADDVY